MMNIPLLKQFNHMLHKIQMGFLLYISLFLSFELTVIDCPNLSSCCLFLIHLPGLEVRGSRIIFCNHIKLLGESFSKLVYM